MNLKTLEDFLKKSTEQESRYFFATLMGKVMPLIPFRNPTLTFCTV